jgi:hypothetical protein
MTYVDVTLTPEATYTYVNCRQVYDAIAGAMTTHPAWDFIESVDAVSGGTTYRRYVWRCTAAQSGLSANFFVVFEVPFTTATGPVTGWATTTLVRVYLGETYAAGVLGKFATNATSVTLAADLTNPATFTQTTYTQPASLWNTNNTFGVNAVVTSYRFICLVTNDAAVMTRNENLTASLLYAGAYASVMSAAVDPLPIVLLGRNVTGGTYGGGGATRAPTFTPATAYTEVFQVSSNYASGNNIGENSNAWELFTLSQIPGGGAAGALGSAANVFWFKNLGGPVVSRLGIYPAVTNGQQSAKGIFRGYLKNVYGANAAAHAFGDTFIVNGKVHVGLGATVGAVLDTEAV